LWRATKPEEEKKEEEEEEEDLMIMNWCIDDERFAGVKDLGVR
jgi:hypothetical protein